MGLVELVDSTATQDSVFLHGMGGPRLLVAVAHGEGLAPFVQDAREAFDCRDPGAARYVDGSGKQTEI